MGAWPYLLAAHRLERTATERQQEGQVWDLPALHVYRLSDAFRS